MGTLWPTHGSVGWLSLLALLQRDPGSHGFSPDFHVCPAGVQTLRLCHGDAFHDPLAAIANVWGVRPVHALHSSVALHLALNFQVTVCASKPNCWAAMDRSDRCWARSCRSCRPLAPAIDVLQLTKSDIHAPPLVALTSTPASPANVGWAAAQAHAAHCQVAWDVRAPVLESAPLVTWPQRCTASDCWE